MSCIKDMNDLKDVLVKYAKFKPENIILMTDDLTGKLFPTAKNIREQVSALKNRIPKDALLIVAFSCHGTMIDHQDGSPVKSYLCAQDTKITNINSFIDREWLFKTIDECPAEKKLLFCDACRSLTTKSQLKSISERTPEGKAIRVMKMETPSKASWNYNYIFMASCSEGQISIDSGVNGLFIAFLLEGIRTGGAALQDGDLTAFSWFDYASKKTRLVSQKRFLESPNIGMTGQTEQTPRINIPAEASSFIIAKIDRPIFNIVLPDDPNKIRVQTYSINDLDDIEINSDVKPSLNTPIKSGKIQLPPIPEEMSKLLAVNRGIIQALEDLKNGTHPVLDKPKAVLAEASLQYDSIKAKRDDMWQKFNSSTRAALERSIAQNPNASPTFFDSLRPRDIGYSEFIRLVLFGKKTEQAKNAYEKVQVDINAAFNKKKKSIQEEYNENVEKLADLNNAFREKVLLILLEKCDGFDDISVTELPDEGSLFLTDAIPSLLSYKLGWDEQSLWASAKTVWKGKRPIVKKRISNENARAGKRAVKVINGVEFAFRYCPAGEFTMGSPKGEVGKADLEEYLGIDIDKIEKQHQVTLTEGFWMMETEVTVGMFKVFVNDTGYESKGYLPYGWNGSEYEQDPKYSWKNPGLIQNDNHPVTCVSWEDAVEFCKWLESKIGGNVQLPTEAQWEYACRAGSTTAFYWGNSLNGDRANCNGTYPCGTSTRGKYAGTTTPAGRYKANNWNIYDMSGNVYEWCQDWYGDYPDGKVTDPTGPSSGTDRVIRGGSWYHGSPYCRSAYRYYGAPEYRYYYLGFRCVRSKSRPEK